MRTLTLLAISALSLANVAPAFAQNAMMKDNMHAGAMAHMSAADTRRMKKCDAMPHDRMMHSAMCVKMMQMHHEGMMSHDGAMGHTGAMGHPDAMKSGGMMSHDSMTKPGQ